MANTDFIYDLGTLVVDHRLRRIVDRLLAGQAEVYEHERIPFDPRWTSTFLLLEGEGPLGVTEIAGRIRLTHPWVIKLTNAMIEAGLVSQLGDAKDERRRLLQLTPAAKRLAPRLHRIWDALRESKAEVFRQAGYDVLEMLERVEAQLARKSLRERVNRRLSSKER